MNRTLLLLSLLGSLATAGPAWGQQQRSAVSVVIAKTATATERLAAQELLAALQRIYPGDRFVVADPLPPSGTCILVGNFATDAEVKKRVDRDQLRAAESYVVTSATEGPRQLGIVAGADPRGVAYGVYALLERLGCGFYLSYDAFPPLRSASFNFADWQLTNRPLVPDRLVFDWHNFLSGCSTWNLEHWQSWIRQSQKMGFNAIMVHAYGNNPMVSYAFDGQTKPVGYLSTTAKGRDWSTMHVNDTRRLWGGEVFTQAVFGADAAFVPDNQRAAAAQKLMQDVFADAAERSMDVYFADDVDTLSANPQELIQTLPAAARFATGGGKVWLANPQTPEGYLYYKTQIESLLRAYPQITTLVVWFRGGGTPWLDPKLNEMPPSWQTDYQAELARTPETAALWHAPQMFALSKVVHAFDRALQETGHSTVRLAAGTWDFKFLAPCDRFFAPHVKLIGLDYNVLHDRPQLATSESRQVIREVAAHRAVLPVIWAQHDDGNYVGRPYTPFADFQAKLADAKVSGFGIIHWTTRPLDLFFTSHAKQVWQGSQDQPLRATCEEMAEKSFGIRAREPMGEYLHRWVTEAPKFARETSDRFIDRPLTNVAAIVADSQERLKLLDAVDVASLTQAEKDRVNYFRGLEEFIAAIHQCQDHFQRSQALCRAGDLAAARAAISQCRPDRVIQQFAQFNSLDGRTRGEQGLVVSLNLRWLPHYVRHRQSLGIEPVRYRFAPTSHDPLAQSPGRFTFHFDTQHHLWECLGEQETGASTFTRPQPTSAVPGGTATDDEELCRTGIQSERPIGLTLRPIMTHATPSQSATLPAGHYRLRLLFLDPTSTAPGQRVFTVQVTPMSALELANYTFNPVRAAYLRVVAHGNSENDWNSLTEVRLSSLATAALPARATASSEASGYPAAAAIDGKPETRWAARGDGQWIQFRLDPTRETKRIQLAWFQASQRQARFDLLTSSDGEHWTPVETLQRDSVPSLAADRIDIFQETKQADRILERAYPVTLEAAGEVAVTVTPIQGKALICGAVLEPLDQSTQGN